MKADDQKYIFSLSMSGDAFIPPPKKKNCHIIQLLEIDLQPKIGLVEPEPSPWRFMLGAQVFFHSEGFNVDNRKSPLKRFHAVRSKAQTKNVSIRSTREPPSWTFRSEQLENLPL